MAKREPATVIGGLGLLGAGAWLIASGLGLPLLGFGQVWPLIPLVVGLALVAQHAGQQGSSRGLLLIGLPILLTGAFLGAFTLQIGGLTWGDMAAAWPVFPLIVGFTFLMVYISGGLREEPLLVLTYVFGGVGLAALPITLGVLGGALLDQALRLWPLLLLVVVLAVVLRLRMQKRPDAESELS